MLKEIESQLSFLRINDDLATEKIADFFKRDVLKYLEFLKSIEASIRQNLANPETIQSSLNNETLKIVKKGYDLETTIKQKSVVEQIKHLFRLLILPWMGQSSIMKRALGKPRGYPGDYEMLEYIYNNKPVSSGIGYYFDKGFLACELCEAVRNRKNKMSDLIEGFLLKTDNPVINILNIACGSCDEIVGLPQSNASRDKAHFFCLDYDEAALDYAKNNLSQGGRSATFIKADIIDAIKNKDSHLFKNKHLIYSIGLTDYLPDRILKGLLQLCYNGLEPGGELIFSLKDRDQYLPMREDWLSDWKFVPRNQKQLLDLISEIGLDRSQVEIERENTQIIFFAKINKK